MRSFVEYFKENFYQKLLTPNGNNPVRNRADSLLTVFDELYNWWEPPINILETGCMRPDHGMLCFGDDGCSTWIFDKFLERILDHQKCEFVSIDNNLDNIKYSKSLVSKYVDFRCGDSIEEIWRMDKEAKFNLIYLDSYDVEKNNPLPAQIHALKELTACMQHLMRKAIIIVDDYKIEKGFIGKGKYVKEFLDNIGAECLHEGYQLVYKISK